MSKLQSDNFILMKEMSASLNEDEELAFPLVDAVCFTAYDTIKPACNRITWDLYIYIYIYIYCSV
jgi:hypothetical protein